MNDLTDSLVELLDKSTEARDLAVAAGEAGETYDMAFAVRLALTPLIGRPLAQLVYDALDDDALEALVFQFGARVEFPGW